LAIFGKFWNGSITINSQDLSDHVQSAKLTIGKEVFDLSTFSNAARVRSAIGLEEATLELSMVEDINTNKVYQTLKAIYDAGTGTAVTFKLDSGAKAVTNPSFEFNAILADGKLPIGGQHGALLKTDVSLVSTGAITVDTTP
jgi:hypothetical protein